MPRSYSRRALFGQPLDALSEAMQPPAPEGDPRVFPKLFPNPTGNNGWEEFVLAGDLIRGVPAIESAQNGSGTLTQKRAAINHPNARRALGLIRSGLAKPVASPRQVMTAETTFPDMALFRALARLLAMEQNVHFADGRFIAAMESFRTGLRLSDVPRTESLIGGLVGGAMLAIGLTRCVRHLDALPQRECDGLVALLRQYLAADDRAALALVGERRYLDNLFGQMERDGDVLVGLAPEPDEDDEDLSPQDRADQRRLHGDLLGFTKDQGRRTELIGQVRTMADRQLHLQLAALNAPWEEPRPAVPARADDSVAARVARMIFPSTIGASRFAEQRTQAQLLAVHAQIRRWRWEMDKLPESLDELRAGDLIVDPFCRKPLTYKKLGDVAYDLESIGPAQLDDNGDPIPGQRRALALPYRAKG